MAFDQASNHVGFSRIEYRAGRVILVGGEEIPGTGNNHRAADFCCRVMDDPVYPHETIRAVALEDCYFRPYTPKDLTKKNAALGIGWRAVNNLAELRGMVLREIHRRELRAVVVRPADWQGMLGLTGLRSEFIKDRSYRIALGLVAHLVESEMLTEDQADAVHIGLCARKRLREEEFGAPQRELLR